VEVKNRGWTMTAIAVGINMCCGILYSWSVFAAALVNDLGLTKTEAALPNAIGMAMLALMSIPGGKLQDRFGPRISATICGVLVGLGFILASFADSIITLSLFFGFITGAGIGLAYGATTPAAVKWFPPQKRGLISGLVVAGIGLAAVYQAPLTQYLVDSYGVKNTFLIEGILFAAIILILAQFLKSPPAGYVPLGTEAPAKAAVATTGREYTPGEMVRTPQFWFIWLMYGCGSVAGVMIIGQLAIIAEIQANIAWAFVFVAILAVFNTTGRIAGGILADKIGRTNTLLLMFVGQAVNMFFFSSYTTSSLLIMGIAVAGVCYGSLLAVFPTLTFDYFGMKNGGVNYGIVFCAWGLAGVIGPIMGGYIVDQTQSYHMAYLISAGLLIISAILAFLLKAPQGNKTDVFPIGRPG
jgi:OFA family oxalate/formate antiporter-like MFS transporter